MELEKKKREKLIVDNLRDKYNLVKSLAKLWNKLPASLKSDISKSLEMATVSLSKSVKEYVQCFD